MCSKDVEDFFLCSSLTRQKKGRKWNPCLERRREIIPFMIQWSLCIPNRMWIKRVQEHDMNNQHGRQSCYCRSPSNLPGWLRTLKGKVLWDRTHLSFWLCPELNWTVPTASCVQILWGTELKNQKFGQSCNHRTDRHFFPTLPHHWKRKLDSTSW